MMVEGREPPAVITRDYGPMPPLSGDETGGGSEWSRARWRELLIDLKRYYRWLDSGRKADPWASGAGRGISYDTPRVRQGPPVGGYGPGTMSEPEPSAEMQAIEAALGRLPTHQQRLCRWKVVGDDGQPLRDDVIAERLGLGEKALRAEWRRTATRVYWMSRGQA